VERKRAIVNSGLVGHVRDASLVGDTCDLQEELRAAAPERSRQVARHGFGWQGGVVMWWVCIVVWIPEGNGTDYPLGRYSSEAWHATTLDVVCGGRECRR
jgi:hypothetical protein